MISTGNPLRAARKSSCSSRLNRRPRATGRPMEEFLLFCQGNERESFGIFGSCRFPGIASRSRLYKALSMKLMRSSLRTDDGLSMSRTNPEYESSTLNRFGTASRLHHRLTERIQITSGGGTKPRWRRDGRELFYLDQDSRIIAVPVNLSRSSRPVNLIRCSKCVGLASFVTSFTTTM